MSSTIEPVKVPADVILALARVISTLDTQDTPELFVMVSPESAELCDPNASYGVRTWEAGT